MRFGAWPVRVCGGGQAGIPTGGDCSAFDVTIFDGRRLTAAGLQALSEPEGVCPCWKILDPTDELVAAPFVESSSLKVVGEVDSLAASAGHSLGFGRSDEPGSKAPTPEAWVHPEALQFATIAPGPSAYPGYDRPSRIVDEDRQVDFLTESRDSGRLSADLSL